MGTLGVRGDPAATASRPLATAPGGVSGGAGLAQEPRLGPGRCPTASPAGRPSWGVCEGATAVKLEDQREHVAWWDANVRPAGGKEAQAIVAERGQLLPEVQAERDTGIGKRVVSRWRNGLADESAYRERMYGPRRLEADMLHSR